MNIRERIIDGFKKGKLTFKTVNEIHAALHLPQSYKKVVRATVKNLQDKGIIVKGGDGGYSTPEQAGVFYARVKGNPQGFAFLIPDGFAERERDYFVSKRHLKGALDGDRVLAAPVRGTQDEAVVLKIAERGKPTVVGRLEVGRTCAYCIPDDRAYASDVYIPLPYLNGAEDGDKVVCQITSYPEGRAVGGKVIERLGRDGDFFCEELALIKSYGLEESFPYYVDETAEKVAAQPILPDGRLDLRGLLTITIDGVDTRDIDDAVSLEIVDGDFRLGVHIADVSHYVKPNGCIDKCAYERGTSVYFPDRVLPMLPKALSNGACSLNEGEERYAMSVFITFSPKGEVKDSQLFESVIVSDRRMTYDEVTAILNTEEKGVTGDGGKTAGDGKEGEIALMLKRMEKLCLLLERKREALGEVTLDVKEAHIYLNERGEVVIPDYERAISHRIIEQFMVSANEAVARLAFSKKAPFLYRIHEKPAPEKAELLYSFLKDLGVNAKGSTEDATPTDYQKILHAVEGKPYASIVNRVMLRSMQKARYSEENLGHFGLASECYCHFTSPIRRYPDLFVHRVLKCIIHGELPYAKEKFAPVARQTAIDTSERERRADAVERDVDDLYKLAYMQERIGETFDAVISGVIESGIFCELANTVEGMVRLESLPADSYDYFPEKFLLKGKRHSYRIGDKVTIVVAGCDLASRKIQFTLA